MNIFVASWFFPPSTSSEDIVAYKLLSHSEHQYDVCSSTSDNWGYKHTLDCTSDNIRSLLVNTDSIDEWVERAIEIFEKEYPTRKYEAIMTRSMPPESIIVGQKLKEKYPDLLWIASLGDPLSRVPHMMKDFLDKTKSLTRGQKSTLKLELSEPGSCNHWRGVGDAGVDVLQQYKEWENTALHNADMVITPNGPQLAYMLCGFRRSNARVVPHSFDLEMYPDTSQNASKDDVKELVFLGFSNNDRSLVPVVEAVNVLRINNPEALKRLKIRFIGNITDDSSVLVSNYYLDDVISVEPSVSYVESLGIMKNADWLIHVDAFYPQFEKTGGSVYFAGKLADYIGAGKPILAISGKGSPAYRAVELCGGMVFDAWAVNDIAFALEKIALGQENVQINKWARGQYDARVVGKLLDKYIEEMIQHPGVFSFVRDEWPTCPYPAEDKKLTICIPSYNVESTLDRCLYSLVSSSCLSQLDILIVNDGSKDKTAEIGQAYQDHYPGIVTLINKENGGHGSTINTGLAHARGEYFKVLDGDDWFDSKALADLVDYIDSLSSPVDLISTDYCQVNMRNGKRDAIKKKTGEIFYDVVYNIADIDVTKEYFSLGSTTYRTELLRECGLELSENTFYVDVEYQMIPLPYVSTIAFTKDSLYRYAVGNINQSVSKRSFVNRYDHHTAVMKRVLDYYRDNLGKMNESTAKYYKKLIIDNFMKTQFTISLLYDEDWPRAAQRAKEFDEYLKQGHPDLYEAVGKKYKAIATARQYEYDSEKYSRPKTLNTTIPSAPKRAVLKRVEKLMRGRVGEVVAREVKKRK